MRAAVWRWASKLQHNTSQWRRAAAAVPRCPASGAARPRCTCPSAHSVPQHAATRLYSSADAAASNGKRLYVLDLMPLVYRFLPRDPSSAAAPRQQRQQQQPGEYPAVERSSPAADFMGLLLNLMARKDQPPTHLAVVVDVPGATYRRLRYPQYKAHRTRHPPQLVAVISSILSLVEALGLPILALPGVEADDVVGSLAVKAAHDGFDVVVVSTDKDFYQLLGPRVAVLRQPPHGELYGMAQFRAEFGLDDPALFRDVKALMGDASDNIPGVKGVGEKTALALVQRWGDLGGVFGALDGLAPDAAQQAVKLNRAQQAMLRSEEGRAAASFAKNLVTINTSLKAPPLREAWGAYELKLPSDGGKLAEERAQKLQLHFLYARLQDLFKRWQRAAPQQASQP